MNPEIRFLAALVFTIATETSVLFFLVLKVFRLRDIRNFQLGYAGLMANSSSLPYLWFVLPGLCESYTVFSVVGEVVVTAWEAWFYYMFLRIPFKNAATLSFLANLASFLFGLLIFG